MQYLDVGLAMLAFFGLCAFFNRRCGVAGGRTPLLTTAVLILWLMLFGVAGALHVGGWLLYLVGYALGVLAFTDVHKRCRTAERTPVKNSAPPLFDPGFAFFWAVSLTMAVLFAVRRPMFLEWDEMSFWGTACKLVSINDELYTTAEIGWDWIGAQHPGAILMSYFFQFFGEFAPWKTFVGYNVLLFAAFAAVVSAVTDDGERAGAAWRRYTLALPAALVCVLTPYLLTHIGRILSPTTVYMCAYGDVPAGIAAGGAAAWYYAARRSGRCADGRVLSRGMWGVFPVLAAMGLIKENAFPVLLVAAGTAAADALFCETDKKLWRRFGFAAAALAAPVAAYLCWSRHIGAVVALRESAGEVGATNLTTAQVIVLGLKQTLSPAQRDPLFAQVIADMLQAFTKTKVSLVGAYTDSLLINLLGENNPVSPYLGTGVCTVVLILLLFVLAAVLCADRVQRRRTLWAAVLSTAGFAAYYWVLMLSYAFIFKAHQAAQLENYTRYVATYYLFWFLLAVVHLVCAARADRPRHSLTGCALLLAAACLLTVSQMIPAQMSVLAYPERIQQTQRSYEQKAQALSEQIADVGAQGSIFYVNTRDIGNGYFNYCHHLLPLQMDYSFGGGPIGHPENDDGSMYYHAYTRAELEDYLQERGIVYVFVQHADEVFLDEYAPLFADGLAAAQEGLTQLYVRLPGEESVVFAPCTDGLSWEEICDAYAG